MKKLILLFIILFTVGCEKKEGESYSKDLIGNWEGFKSNNSYHIISTVSQTLNNPHKPGAGSIILESAEEATLRYMYLYSINGVRLITMAQNAFGFTDEDTNYVLTIYDIGDYGSSSQLNIYYSDVSELYEGELDFTTNGSEITVNSGALYHSFLNDSVTATGTLAPAQLDVTAGSDIELGNFDWEYESHEVNIIINDDKSFEKTIHTIDSETLEFSGTWEATNTEILFHDTNNSETYEYSLINDELELILVNDLCLSNPDECLPQYELMYGMKNGSLESVVLKETTYFKKTSN